MIFIISILAVSCRPSPQPINYNEDECAYCKMKISDSRFGAELVTNKGKVYKYDSAECLFRTCVDNGQQKYAFLLVTDYSTPGTLIPAKEAFYLISIQQPSPMGGNLSAYAEKGKADQAKNSKSGEIYSFDEVLEIYNQVKS